MGMYTSVRGWLQWYDWETKHEDKEARLEAARQEYFATYPENRTWLPEGTFLAPKCFNGENFIFIGCDLKNYDDDYNCWLPILCKHFPTASGRIDCQYEEQYFDERDGSSNVLTIRIREGKLLPDWTEVAWC